MHKFDMLADTALRQHNAAREAQLEHRRLVREALMERRVRLYQSVLVRLGRRMVLWGTQLQHRYDDRQPAPEVKLAAQPK